MAKGRCFGYLRLPEPLPEAPIIETSPWNGSIGLTTTARQQFWAMQIGAENRAASIFGIAGAYSRCLSSLQSLAIMALSLRRVRR